MLSSPRLSTGPGQHLACPGARHPLRAGPCASSSSELPWGGSAGSPQARGEARAHKSCTFLFRSFLSVCRARHSFSKRWIFTCSPSSSLSRRVFCKEIPGLSLARERAASQWLGNSQPRNQLQPTTDRWLPHRSLAQNPQKEPLGERRTWGAVPVYPHPD